MSFRLRLSMLPYTKALRYRLEANKEFAIVKFVYIFKHGQYIDHHHKL